MKLRYLGLLLLSLCSLSAWAQPYKGDIYLGDTITHEWNAYTVTGGADVERVTTFGTAACYPNGSATEITAGITDTAASEFDSIVGQNLYTVVATTANGYLIGTDYDCVIKSSSLNGVTVSIPVFSFSIENRVGTKGMIKDRGTMAAGSTATLINLGAKISADNVWNGMQIWNVTKGEFAVICLADDNGSTDTLSVAGFNTTPSTSDVYRILLGPPFSCVPFPTVVGGRVGVYEVAGVTIPANAVVGSNTYFDNGGTPSTALIGVHVAAAQSADNKLGTFTNLGSGATAAANLLDLATATRLLTGTADSGTTATMVDAALTQSATDYWTRDVAIIFTSGSIQGQVACVSKFTPGTDTIEFTPPATAAVSTNTYVLIPGPGCDPFR